MNTHCPPAASLRLGRALAAALPALLGLLVLLGLGGCAHSPLNTLLAPGQAEAVLRPTRGNTAVGVIRLEQKGRLVRLSGTVSGLTPGAHGLHIHERRDCAGPAALPSDPHFNPFGKRHGDPARAERHAGDLPMLVAGQNGTARYDVLLDGISLGGGPQGVLGRALVVKSRPDDSTTQPGGNAGPGVSCGVIEPR